MWMFFGLMGVLLASSVVDSSLRADDGAGGSGSDGEGGDGAESRPDDPWLDEWDNDEYISDDDDPPEDDEDEDGGDDDDNTDAPPGDDDDDNDGERPPDDPWLDEWDDDEYISDDDHPPDDGEEDDDDGGDGGDGDEEDGERPPDDPWLDEWDDDEYISSDSISLALARAQDDEALHVMGSGDRLVAGEGGVYVLGDWIDAENPAEIADFQPGADRLIYAHAEGAGIPEITLANAPEAGGPEAGGAALLADGQPVLLFKGGEAPQADAVLLFPVNLDQAAGAERG
ncbi:MAG: hypothetical protein JJT95_08885 [Pararhodobacter sp.]|nr:hypothetical protein [Pararhodobacter sp.]